jgi:phosphatidylinositol glycan class C protein
MTVASPCTWDCAFRIAKHLINSSRIAPSSTPCFDSSRVSSMTSPPSSRSPLPPPIPVGTHPYRASDSNTPEQERIPDPNRLAPEDAYFAPSLSRIRSAPVNYDESLRSLNGDGPVSTLRPPRGVLGGDPNRKDVRKLGAGRRRRKGAWKKLLWVKQSCMS